MADPLSVTPKNERVDRFGAVASSLCALHCAICALLPAAFGALGLGMLLSPKVEWIFTLIAVTFAFVALVLVLRQKRSYTVAGLLSLGIIGLLASRGLEMGSEHHHGEAHHAEEGHHGEEKHHGEEEHHDQHGAHADEGEEHSDSMHSIGASMGVFGGFLLLFGHLLNIRDVRNVKKDDCCDC